jgi:hypothetical protein
MVPRLNARHDHKVVGVEELGPRFPLTASWNDMKRGAPTITTLVRTVGELISWRPSGVVVVVIETDVGLDVWRERQVLHERSFCRATVTGSWAIACGFLGARPKKLASLVGTRPCDNSEAHSAASSAVSSTCPAECRLCALGHTVISQTQ